MSRNYGFSDEHLNAFVDGQLDASETNLVKEAMSHDSGLNLKVNELRKLKELVRYAFSTPPREHKNRLHNTTRLTKSKLFSSAMAAGLLTIGTLGGWFWHYAFISGNTSSASIATVKKLGTVIQVSDNDPKKWALALRNATNLRKEYAAEQMDIEIVASGPGLEMFKTDSSLSQGLETVAKSGVKLLACGNTMKLANITREELNLQVEVVKAGVIEIVQKQQLGYSYVKP